MAVRFDSNGMVTTINVDNPNPAPSYTNGSSTRKFVSPDLVQNYNTTDQSFTSDSEDIVDTAAGLGAIAAAAVSVATSAAGSLATARAALAAVVPNATPASQNQNAVFTDDDAAAAAQGNINSAIAGLSVSTDRNVAATGDLVNGSLSTFFPTKQQNQATSVANQAVPEIDSITQGVDVKKGTVDCFYSTTTFSLLASDVVNIDAIRIFRCTVLHPTVVRSIPQLSAIGVDRIRSNTLRSRAKNQDYTSALEIRLGESGVSNAITNLTPIDPLQNIRQGATLLSQSLSVDNQTAVPAPTGDDKTLSDLQPYLYPDPSLLNLDPSVANDLLTLRNIQIQNPKLVTAAPAAVVTGGATAVKTTGVGATAARAAQAAKGDGSNLVVAKNNSSEYREIAFISPSKLQNRIIGSNPQYVQFSFEDPTVNFGRSYKYFITTVDSNLQESVRSRVVQITIDGLRVPAAPSRVSTTVISGWVALAIQCPDQLTEKFEIYRQSTDIPEDSKLSLPIRRISGVNGYTAETGTSTIASNGFIQIGESVNALHQGGATFFDRNALQGRRYTYRVYAVDIFGNKSQASKEVTVFIPEPQSKHNALKNPTLLAEIDQVTGKVKLTFGCPDSRVVALFLERRDLTIDQPAYAPPGQPGFIKMGHGDAARGNSSFDSERLYDINTPTLWTGYFQNSGSIVFVDQACQHDRAYQYRVRGVDKFGNDTSFAFSQKLFIVNQPVLDAPVNMSGALIFSGSDILGVQLTWIDGNTNFTAEEQFGSQSALADSSVRSLFQIERRKTTELNWTPFPLTPETSYLDRVLSPKIRELPAFLPAPLEINQTYLYRAQAIQTGTFISNFGPEISVFVGFPPAAPANFRIRTADPKAQPFYVMLNWDNVSGSGPIDSWEIQRAEVNNFAAGRMNSSNPGEFKNLNFVAFKTVQAESTRFQSVTAGKVADATPNSNKGSVTMTGDNCLMDTQVQFGNTYFYRIRAHAADGEVSAWVSKGIKVTDDSFENKLNGLLSSAEKATLSTTYQPLRISGNVLAGPSATVKTTSFGLVSSGNTAVQPPAVQSSPPTATPAPQSPAPLPTSSNQSVLGGAVKPGLIGD